MRCKACNTILETGELTKKDSMGHFYDMCRTCLNSVYRSELYDDDILLNVPPSLLTLDDI